MFHIHVDINYCFVYCSEVDMKHSILSQINRVGEFYYNDCLCVKTLMKHYHAKASAWLPSQLAFGHYGFKLLVGTYLKELGA